MISIIIPVYNACTVLPRCLRSVMAQTVTDWNLLLVDDGSTDGSDIICDEWSAKDARIAVLHQKNGGPSKARNLGLEHAVGDKITFLDADDEVHPQYLEILDRLLTDDVDLSAVTYQLVDSGHIPSWRKEYVDYDSVSLTRDEAISSLLYQGLMDPSPCCKLYRKSALRYPEHLRVYEDLTYTVELLYTMRHIRVASLPLYAYYKCNAGIHFESVTSMQAFDAFDALEEWMIEHCPHHLPALHSRRLSMNFNNLRLLYGSSTRMPIVKARCWQEICAFRHEVLFDSRVRLKNKIGILFSYLKIF